MRIFHLAAIIAVTFAVPSFAQLNAGIEANLLRQQIQQNQKTPVDLSTEAGRKVYLLEHPQYSGQYTGTDGGRKFQEAADRLAGKPSSGEGLYESLKASNPSLTKESLSTMSESDIRTLFYNKYRQEGKSMGEARELASKVAIPSTR